MVSLLTYTFLLAHEEDDPPPVTHKPNKRNPGQATMAAKLKTALMERNTNRTPTPHDSEGVTSTSNRTLSYFMTLLFLYGMLPSFLLPCIHGFILYLPLYLCLFVIFFLIHKYVMLALLLFINSQRSIVPMHAHRVRTNCNILNFLI